MLTCKIHAYLHVHIPIKTQCEDMRPVVTLYHCRPRCNSRNYSHVGMGCFKIERTSLSFLLCGR